MSEILGIARTLEDVAARYGLRTLYLDLTDTTLLSRVGFSHDVFIQVYANARKKKLNMALVVAGERVYGIDGEGGLYHEHPFEDPVSHVGAGRIDVEDFVAKSLDFLRRMSLI